MKIIDKKKFREYYQTNRRSIGIAGIFLIIAYGIKMFQIMFSHDTEAIISVPDSLYDSWMTMGRYGLIFLKKIFGIYTFNPYLASVLMFFAMLGIVVVWGYLFFALSGETERYSKESWIFPVFFLTAPMMVEQISFLLQAFEVCLAVLLLEIVLLMVWHGIFAEKYLWFLPSVILSALAFSVYQTTVPLFVAGAAAGFLVCFRKRHRSWWSVLFQLVGVFGVSFLLYEIVNKVLMNSLGITTTDYISDQLMWGSVSVSQCVENIRNHIYQAITGQGFYYSVSFGIAAILAILILILKWKKGRKEFYLYIIATAVFLLTPFMMTILMGQEPKMRTQLCLGFVTGFYFQYSVIWFWEAGKKLTRGFAYAVLCLAVAFGFHQSTKAADMFYTEYVQYQEDVRLALKISNRIDLLDLGEHPEEPLVFVGARSPQLNHSAVRDLENIGHSFFEWSFTTGYGSFIMRNFMASIGYEYNSPTDEQIQIAEQAAPNMGVWPASDSVQVVEGVIVVRLS